jgi:maltose alpha-D-glucosyltransferase / alpha-amylase
MKKKGNPSPTGPDWLRTAVFYQIYPQSFFDTNGDGIGDLQGIIDKLDYIASLGVNALWLNPIYESPFLDAGYDVADFRKVAPRYGTNADAKRLFREAHKRGMRVVLDLVAGHTSIEHPWFQASSLHKKNKYSDYYIWSRDMWQAGGNEKWIHGFGPRDGSFITNFFWSQPALNYGYANPDPKHPWEQPPSAPGPKAVRKELEAIMRFWLDAGCDGFRVDMAPSLIKGPPDSKPLRALWRDIRGWMNKDYPEAVLVAEWGHPTQAIGAGFHIDFMIPVGKASYNHLFGCWSEIRGDHREPHAFFERAGGGDAVPFFKEYLEHLKATENSGYIAIPTGNHDFARLRHGRTPEEMRCIHAMLLTMPGVPFLYYGDEIGMDYLENLEPKEGSFFGRTGSRTPMQWTPGANKGFSKAPAKSLYLPVDRRKGSPDVATQEKSPDSHLHFVRNLLRLRATEPALSNSSGFRLLFAKPKACPLVYERFEGSERIVVVVNPRAKPAECLFDFPVRSSTIQRLVGEADLEPKDGKLVCRSPGLSYGIFKIT